MKTAPQWWGHSRLIETGNSIRRAWRMPNHSANLN